MAIEPTKRPKTPPSARTVASAVLAAVWSSDVFAAAALSERLAAANLERRDVGLATELTYGVLRTQPYLEERIVEVSRRGALALAPVAQAQLFVAAYSILFLDRIPSFAAVDEAVGAIGREGGSRASGFANAVLRKLVDSRTAKLSLSKASVRSAPAWLKGALREALGRSGSTAFLAAGPWPPPVSICVGDADDRDAWIERIASVLNEAEVVPSKYSPHGVEIRGGGDLRKLPGHGKDWIVQEEGAQLVTLAVRASEGDRVLDACAGRGNKTFLLRRAVGTAGRVDAADLSGTKLDVLAGAPSAPNSGGGRGYRVDWSTGVGDVPSDYDQVLVDAPCSAVGTLRRRPEIGLRRKPEDIPRLAELQLAITRNAASRLRVGGHLTYAVCSVLTPECEGVVEALCAARLAQGSLKLVGEPRRLLPHIEGTDGYFMARLVLDA